jgi:hypothetical protein
MFYMAPDHTVQEETIHVNSDGLIVEPTNPYWINMFGFQCRLPGQTWTANYCSDVPMPGLSCDIGELEFNGLKLSLMWKQGTGEYMPATLPPTDGYSFVAVLIGEGVGVGLNGMNETVILNCSMTFPESDRIVKQLPGSSGTMNLSGSTRSFQLKLNLIFESSSVFINQGPSEISGAIGETVSSQLALKVPNGFAGGLNLSWDINEGDVCKNWNPSLRLDSGGSSSPGIGINHVSTLALSPGDNPLVATFVPTEAGGFTCHGTLRVSID